MNPAIPTQKEIAEQTAELRKGWSPEDFSRRAVGFDPEEQYEIPEVKSPAGPHNESS